MARRHVESLAERAVAMNAALASVPRMKIMKALGSSERGTVSVSDVAGMLGMAQSTATKHLQVLHDAGFVKRRKVGATVYYSDDSDALAEYRRIIDCAFLAQKTPCINGWDCDSCPDAATCNTGSGTGNMGSATT